MIFETASRPVSPCGCCVSVHQAEEIVKAGGKALPLVVDVREEGALEAAMAQTAAHFGGIDVLGTTVRDSRRVLAVVP